MMNGDFAWYAPFFYLSGFAKVFVDINMLAYWRFDTASAIFEWLAKPFEFSMSAI